MTCFCSARLGSLVASLTLLPPTLHLVPPLPPSLLAVAAGPALGGFGPMPAAQAALTANLTAMASLSASLQAAMGMRLTAAMAPAVQASLQASLAATVQSFQAAGSMLALQAGPLANVTLGLTGLTQLAALVLSVQAAFGIDLRASGALLALQARLDASASAAVQVSAVAAAMAALGLRMDAQGALAANASATALASMVASLPSLSLNLPALLQLSGLVSMVATVQAGLGVNLLAMNAMASLKAALSGLPLAALANLNVTAKAAATAALAAPVPPVPAVPPVALNLQAVASANLAGVPPLAMLLALSANAKLGLPAGSCGQPCPLALLAAPGLSGSASVAA
ncbi:hypothetical protein [Pseudorhodoferax sp. Leaf274]|uniref:hypothetical protein n=1 Tax=Pseudorhodoferax sp. Leaf274 TaxID=1736318 RepID=UPI000703C071|nr:hypothetical protein [Pseudorhodoferax sp. Leaf274]KQP35426.1 hypothetical protein ASF44_18960 [Pseudorhodoferax sp. Leaf274]